MRLLKAFQEPEIRQAYLISAAVWVLTAPVSLAPALGAPEPLPWWDYMGVVLVALAGFALTPFLLTASRLGERIEPKAIRVVAMAVSVLVTGLLHSAFDVALWEQLRLTFAPQQKGLMFRSDSGELIKPHYVFFLMQALIQLVWVHAGVAALVVMNRLNWRVRRRELRKSEARAAANEAQLATIRLQLSPHFLFNTLNAISSLVLTQRNAQAERMVARLSDYLRSSLGATQVEQVRLAEELQAVGAYLDIESQRFDGRLTAEVECDDALLDAMTPTFLLQPLAEQAVDHAISPPNRSVVVRIKITDDGDLGICLRVETRSQGAPAANAPKPELSGVRERLQTVYGDRATVADESDEREYRAVAWAPLALTRLAGLRGGNDLESASGR